MPKITYTTSAGLVQATGNGIFLNTIGTAVAAAGSDESDATALSTDGSVIPVTAANNNRGVILPSGTVGQTLWIVNTVANKTLKVYPASGEKINNGTATTGDISLAAGKSGLFVYHSDTYGWANIDAG